MSTALPTASSAYGPDRPSAVATVDNATPQGSTYRRGNPVQRNGAGSAVLWQNIALALGIKVVFLGLAVFGNATMWMAVFADMGASLLVVANGLRMLRTSAPQIKD